MRIAELENQHRQPIEKPIVKTTGHALHFAWPVAVPEIGSPYGFLKRLRDGTSMIQPITGVKAQTLRESLEPCPPFRERWPLRLFCLGFSSQLLMPANVRQLLAEHHRRLIFGKRLGTLERVVEAAVLYNPFVFLQIEGGNEPPFGYAEHEKSDVLARGIVSSHWSSRSWDTCRTDSTIADFSENWEVLD
jgi:hypothetical protein